MKSTPGFEPITSTLHDFLSRQVSSLVSGVSLIMWKPIRNIRNNEITGESKGGKTQKKENGERTNFIFHRVQNWTISTHQTLNSTYVSHYFIHFSWKDYCYTVEHRRWERSWGNIRKHQAMITWSRINGWRVLQSCSSQGSNRCITWYQYHHQIWNSIHLL